MDITIGTKKYRLIFRHIIRCEIRTREKFSRQLAVAEAQCRPPDVFDEYRGKKMAFRDCVAQIQNLRPELKTKDGRRELWKQLLTRLEAEEREDAAEFNQLVEGVIRQRARGALRRLVERLRSIQQARLEPKLVATATEAETVTAEAPAEPVQEPVSV